VPELEDSEDEDEEVSILPSTINSWTLVGESWVKDDIMTPEEIFWHHLAQASAGVPSR
jgi:hypothetical protein